MLVWFRLENNTTADKCAPDRLYAQPRIAACGPRALCEGRRKLPESDINKMKAALRKHGKAHEFQVYPNAPHAFFADYRKSYRARAAKDAWKRALAWFDRHLS